MGREFELKYRATPEKLMRMAEDYPDAETITMETTYYEAPSGCLGQRRWTLRRRMENGVSVCTLKTPLPDGSKGEWETVCNDILEAVPRLIGMGAPAELANLTAGGVSPLCGARFTRRAVKASFGESVVEIAMDQGVLLGGGKELPLCEAEVELKAGYDMDAVTFAALLADRYGLTPEPKSKFKRARDLAK